jgi:hypothetical protein
MLVFTEGLFDRRGRRIGSDAASCVRLFDTGTYDQAVTGGTGRFDGVRGTVTVDQQAAGDRFTFRLRKR